MWFLCEALLYHSSSHWNNSSIVPAWLPEQSRPGLLRSWGFQALSVVLRCSNKEAQSLVPSTVSYATRGERKSLCLSCACDVLSAELLFFPNPVSPGPVLSLPHFGAGPKSFPLLSPSTQLSHFLSCHICNTSLTTPPTLFLHTPRPPGKLTVQCCVSVKVY